MGQTYADATFSNPEDPNKRITISGLVDTGAHLSIIPKEFAEKLGVRPKGYMPILTVNGRVEMAYTDLKIKINNDESSFRTLISPTMKTVVIGLIVLEALGYKVNPVIGKLEKAIIEEYLSLHNSY